MDLAVNEISFTTSTQLPSSTAAQLSDSNYSLFVFHVFYISSFRWQCNGAFLRKSHKVYPSAVWTLI